VLVWCWSAQCGGCVSVCTQDDYIYQVSEKYDTELFADLDSSEAKEVTRLLK
jgi:hypothetical protein